jgi:hypothetical protein
MSPQLFARLDSIIATIDKAKEYLVLIVVCRIHQAGLAGVRSNVESYLCATGR